LAATVWARLGWLAFLLQPRPAYKIVFLARGLSRRWMARDPGRHETPPPFRVNVRAYNIQGRKDPTRRRILASATRRCTSVRFDPETRCILHAPLTNIIMGRSFLPADSLVGSPSSCETSGSPQTPQPPIQLPRRVVGCSV
jgi:hypothetical protein